MFEALWAWYQITAIDEREIHNRRKCYSHNCQIWHDLRKRSSNELAAHHRDRLKLYKLLNSKTHLIRNRVDKWSNDAAITTWRHFHCMEHQITPTHQHIFKPTSWCIFNSTSCLRMLCFCELDKWCGEFAVMLKRENQMWSNYNGVWIFLESRGERKVVRCIYMRYRI